MPLCSAGSGGLRNQLNRSTAPIAISANRKAEAALPTVVDSRPARAWAAVVVSVVHETHDLGQMAQAAYSTVASLAPDRRLSLWAVVRENPTRLETADYTDRHGKRSAK